MLYTLAAASLLVIAQSQTDCAWVQDFMHLGGMFAVSMDRCQWSNDTGDLMSWKYQCLGGTLYYINYTDRYCTQGDNGGGVDVTEDMPECSYNCAASSCFALAAKRGMADYDDDTAWFTTNGGDGMGEGDECLTEISWTRETGENLLAVGACVDGNCANEYNPLFEATNTSSKITCVGDTGIINNYTDPTCKNLDYADSSRGEYECYQTGVTTYAFCGATTVVVTPLLALGAFVASLLL
jgi:hypothetical protein